MCVFRSVPNIGIKCQGCGSHGIQIKRMCITLCYGCTSLSIQQFLFYFGDMQEVSHIMCYGVRQTPDINHAISALYELELDPAPRFNISQYCTLAFWCNDSFPSSTLAGLFIFYQHQAKLSSIAIPCYFSTLIGQACILPFHNSINIRPLAAHELKEI